MLYFVGCRLLQQEEKDKGGAEKEHQGKASRQQAASSSAAAAAATEGSRQQQQAMAVYGIGVYGCTAKYFCFVFTRSSFIARGGKARGRGIKDRSPCLSFCHASCSGGKALHATHSVMHASSPGHTCLLSRRQDMHASFCSGGLYTMRFTHIHN